MNERSLPPANLILANQLHRLRFNHALIINIARTNRTREWVAMVRIIKYFQGSQSTKNSYLQFMAFFLTTKVNAPKLNR